MSKGSDRRPLAVDDKTLADNWSRILGKHDGVRVGATPVSKTGNVGAIPTTPAIKGNDESREAGVY